jgi:hypothetical protein
VGSRICTWQNASHHLLSALHSRVHCCRGIALHSLYCWNILDRIRPNTLNTHALTCLHVHPFLHGFEVLIQSSIHSPVCWRQCYTISRVLRVPWFLPALARDQDQREILPFHAALSGIAAVTRTSRHSCVRMLWDATSMHRELLGCPIKAAQLPAIGKPLRQEHYRWDRVEPLLLLSSG